MSATLRSTLHTLARTFASRLIHELITSGQLHALADLLPHQTAPTTPTPSAPPTQPKPWVKNRQRRTLYLGPGSSSFRGMGTNRGHEAIEADVDRLVEYLREARHPVMGLRIRNALGLTKDRFLRTAHRALLTNRIRRVGRMAVHGYEAT